MDPNNMQPSQPQPGESLQPIQPTGIQPQNFSNGVQAPPMQQPVAPPQMPTQQVVTDIVNPAQSLPTPAQPNAQPSVVTNSSKKKPKFLIVIIVGVLLLVGMTVAALLLAQPKKKATTKTTDTQQKDQATSEGPQPAKAIDVEQSNNSINQDISGVNDEEDFPSTQIDDKALGL